MCLCATVMNENGSLDSRTYVCTYVEYIAVEGATVCEKIANRRKREAGHLPPVTDSNNFRSLSARHQSSSSDSVKYECVIPPRALTPMIFGGPCTGSLVRYFIFTCIYCLSSHFHPIHALPCKIKFLHKSNFRSQFKMKAVQ